MQITVSDPEKVGKFSRASSMYPTVEFSKQVFWHLEELSSPETILYS